MWITGPIRESARGAVHDDARERGTHDVGDAVPVDGDGPGGYGYRIEHMVQIIQHGEPPKASRTRTVVDEMQAVTAFLLDSPHAVYVGVQQVPNRGGLTMPGTLAARVSAG